MVLLFILHLRIKEVIQYIYIACNGGYTQL
nr:MAG TPA: hypothetical protein [Caudoviricetes sp.]